MDINKINSALQDLIIRLQDAEKGYKEITKATHNQPLVTWLNRYAQERHEMHRQLEGHMEIRGGEPEVKTSILGNVHRMFLDVKLNAIDDDFSPIVDEIQRGSSVLIEDYNKVLNEVDLSTNLKTTLESQKYTIEKEIKELTKLRNELETVPA